MSLYLANETEVIGQFASNKGYTDLIAASKGFRNLTSLFENGVSESIDDLQTELKLIVKHCKLPDIVSSAKALDTLLEGQDCVVVTDGTTEGNVEKEDGLADESVSKSGSGVLVAFMLPEDIANLLSVDGGEDVDGMHLTLAYMGNLTDLDTNKIAGLESCVESFALAYAPVSGKIGGPVRFNATAFSDDKDVAVASFQCNGIQDFRKQLVSYLEFAGVEVSDNFEYTPHITLAYIDPEADIPVQRIEPIDITFNKITLCLGAQRKNYELLGSTVCKSEYGEGEDDADEEDRADEEDHLGSEDEDENVGKFELTGEIVKLDSEKHFVFGWASIVSVGGNHITDTQGDVIRAHTLENSAYEFVLTARKAGSMHETGDDGSVRGIGRLIESVVFTEEKQKAIAKSLKDQGIDCVVELGCVGWWIGFKVDSEETWQRIKTGELRAFSIGGRGKRASLATEGS